MYLTQRSYGMMGEVELATPVYLQVIVLDTLYHKLYMVQHRCCFLST